MASPLRNINGLTRCISQFYQACQRASSRPSKTKTSCIKALLPCMVVQNWNQQAPIHSQAISKNLIFKSSQEKYQDEKSPVVMLLSWLMSKEKHLEKYINVYLSQGFDVMLVRITPMQLMFPINGSQVVAKQAANWLADHDEYTDITFHGFSVGGYIFGELLNVINNNQKLYDNIINRVRCQIFDSIVAMDKIPTAFPRAVSSNPTAIKLLEIYTKAHLNLMHNVATKHYENSYQTFCERCIKVPSLFMMSEADKFGHHEDMKKIIGDWKENGMQVAYRCWENSPHCSHYLHHPQDYVSEMARLLEGIGLLKDRALLPSTTQ